MNEVSPACAGMIPSVCARCSVSIGEPRMRGDDPHYRLDELQPEG